MFEPASYRELRQEVGESIDLQRNAIEDLCRDVRPLKSDVRRIKPRSTTSISIVGTDGGNNMVAFDPFLVQLVRVVDSSQQDHCLEIVTPTADLQQLRKRHLEDSGKARTPLGQMMVCLKERELYDLSVMISPPPKPLKPSWVQVYRELQEWAVLLDLIRSRNFASDTLVMRDGWLRTKVFRSGLFGKYRAALEEGILEAYRKHKRRIYIAAVLKRSKVLQKYQLALALEGVLRTAYPCYVRVPSALQRKVFEWGEIVGETEDGIPIKDAENMVAGEMFLVKFGSQPHDRIWVVDLLKTQVDQAPAIFGYMLADAQAGFPEPFYPMSLQRAHQHAAITGIDVDILRNHVSDAIRDLLGRKRNLVDEFELIEEGDEAGYGR